MKYLQHKEKKKEKIIFRFELFVFLKAITGVAGLYEIRVEEDGNIYRIFCCMDEGCLVILFNGFQKKNQKTPSGEIERAKRIMNEYFAQKKKGESI